MYLKYYHGAGIKTVLKNIANIITTFMFIGLTHLAILWFWFSDIQSPILPLSPWSSTEPFFHLTPQNPSPQKN